MEGTGQPFIHLNRKSSLLPLSQADCGSGNQGKVRVNEKALK